MVRNRFHPTGICIKTSQPRIDFVFGSSLCLQPQHGLHLRIPGLPGPRARDLRKQAFRFDEVLISKNDLSAKPKNDKKSIPEPTSEFLRYREIDQAKQTRDRPSEAEETSTKPSRGEIDQAKQRRDRPSKEQFGLGEHLSRIVNAIYIYTYIVFGMVKTILI